jgi:release factor glutamine methyltransferase
MATYNQLIHQYRDLFMKKSLSPEVVKAFVFELCNEYGINLYLDLDKEADEKVLQKFNDGIGRLLNDEPLNYVLGYTYFYGYKMIVNEKVLIPRPETEELTALILSQYDEYCAGRDVDLCDVGTGSGAIAIALKKEEDHLRVYASDISEEALSVAKENALLNDCEISFYQGSMLEPYIGHGIKVDILVSNPPYIKQNEEVERSVYDYEPHVALFGGDDGLRFYREIFENAHRIMKEQGMLFFEIGYDQKENLTRLAERYFPDSTIRVFKDINGKDRMLMIKLK